MTAVNAVCLLTLAHSRHLTTSRKFRLFILFFLRLDRICCQCIRRIVSVWIMMESFDSTCAFDFKIIFFIIDKPRCLNQINRCINLPLSFRRKFVFHKCSRACFATRKFWKIWFNRLFDLIKCLSLFFIFSIKLDHL